MKKQDNITPPKLHNLSITESKDIKVDEMPEKIQKTIFRK
jgi:hypothetical protein